jgi:hypothetical protein
MRLGWLAALAMACSGADPADPKEVTEGPTDEVPTVEPTDPTCGNPWVRSTPQDGEGDVFYRSPVVVELTDADPTAAITVAESGGAEVAGSSTVEGAVVTWTGGPLEPDTDYRATLTHACGTDLLMFTTSDVGDPVDVDLIGRTWAMDFAGGTWVEPAGAGAALALVMEPFRILLSVTGPPDGAQIPLLAGIGYDGDQNRCAPTVDLSDSAWSDPYFAIETPVLVMATESFSVTIEDFATSGAFSEDGERIEGATLSGVADTRGLGVEFGLGDAPEAVCELLASLNVSCIPCSDGVVTCLDIDIRGISGVTSPVPLEVVTPEDVAANCAPATP